MANNKSTRTKVAIAVLISIAIVFVGMRVRKEQAERYAPVSYRPAEFPKAVVAPANAVNKSYNSSEFSRSTPCGCYSIRYSVQEPYPAEETRAFVTRTLESHGWRKLKYSLIFPEQLAVNSWTVKEKWKKDPERVFFSENWFNAAEEEEINVIFCYNILDNTGEKEDVVTVQMALSSSGPWIKKLAIYKQMHADEFAEESQVIDGSP